MKNHPQTGITTTEQAEQEMWNCIKNITKIRSEINFIKKDIKYLKNEIKRFNSHGGEI